MYLTVNTKFNPFTYEELVKPLMEYGKAYKEVEDAYSTLSEQAAAFSNDVNKATSPEAYRMYSKYTKALNAAMEDFSKGMTGANRAQLMQMKRDYANSIVPIARASEALKEANAFRDKAGPDAIFEKDRYTSLDPFLRGEVANNKYINASQIASMANAAGLAAGSTLYDEMLTGDTSTREKIAESIASQLGEGYANNERVAYAINAGLDNATATLASKQILSAAEKDAKARAWATINQHRQDKEQALQLQGFKLDDNKKLTIDTDSPIWPLKGVSFDDNGKPILTKTTLTKETPTRHAEIDKDGQFTGRYWDTTNYVFVDDKGYINDNIKFDNINSKIKEITPLSFEAWNGTLNSNSNVQFDVNTENFNIDDSEEVAFNIVKAKDRVLEKTAESLKTVLGYSSTIDTSQVEEMEPYLTVFRDKDPFSNNHFRVNIKGTNAEGKIIDRNEFQKAIIGIKYVLGKLENVNASSRGQQSSSPNTQEQN